jgi:hypothetical protein
VVRPGARRTPLSRLARRSGRLLAVLAALGGPAVLAATPAQAGTYDVWSCRTPTGTPAATTGWAPGRNGADIDRLADGCATGGPLVAGLTAALTHTQGTASQVFQAPEGATIVGYELWRSLSASGLLGLSGYQASISTSAGTVETCDGGLLGCGIGSAGDPLGGGNRITASNVSLSRVQLTAACARAACASAGTAAAEARLHRAKLILREDVAPAVTAAGGSLQSGVTLNAPASLALQVADGGAGVALAGLNVDGSPVAVQTAPGCAQPFTAPQPCPRTARFDFTLDPATLAAGAHQVSVSVADAAGNITTHGPLTVTKPGATDGGTTAGAPVIDVQAQAVAGGRQRLTGTVRTAAGTPLADATVELSAKRDASGSQPTIGLGTARSAADGRFTSRVVPAGAYVVTATVRGSTTAASLRVRSTLALGAKASPSRLRRGGRTTLSGRVTGIGDRASGARVAIQTVIGKRWRTIANVTADRAGRFRWRHRFTKVTRPTVFSFRAVVAKRSGWPWSTVTGQRLRVRVSPR